MPKGLIIGIGNRSRGDDALGPLCLAGLPPVADTLEVFQLQIELAYDLDARPWVICIDAAQGLAREFTFTPLTPTLDHSAFSHALTPAALLAHADAAGFRVPPAWQLAIAGEFFTLGADLTPNARSHLAAAQAFLRAWLQANA